MSPPSNAALADKLIFLFSAGMALSGPSGYKLGGLRSPFIQRECCETENRRVCAAGCDRVLPTDTAHIDILGANAQGRKAYTLPLLEGDTASY